MNRAETVQAAKDVWERKPADFYPTPPDVTQALCDYFYNLYGPKPLRIREPCCGDGAMSRVLIANGHEVTSSDIRETGYGKGGVDYLRLAERDSRYYEFDAVVTNPPFSCAESIIRRALRDAPRVAMLLPSDYWHAKGRRRLFISRPPKAILALTWRPAFLEAERGRSPLANMQWTVWDDRHEGPPHYIPISRPTAIAEVTS